MLVTGASGFIGSHLCRQLAERGAAVHAVSRRLIAARDGVTQLHTADLADGPSVDRLIATIAICHEGVDFASLDGDAVHILFLLVSPRLAKTTGHVIPVDGGLQDGFLR